MSHSSDGINGYENSTVQQRCRSLSRKKRGSANWKKAKAALASLYARIANIRCNAQHQFTSHLTRRHDTIGVEDLNVGSRPKEGGSLTLPVSPAS